MSILNKVISYAILKKEQIIGAHLEKMCHYLALNVSIKYCALASDQVQ
jgi:hypothetical protein